MTATEPSEPADAVEAERRRSDVAVSPWSRGGAMTARWQQAPGPAAMTPSSQWSGSPSSDVSERTVPSTDPSTDSSTGLASVSQTDDEPVPGTRIVRSEPPERSLPTGLVLLAVMAMIAVAATIALVRSNQPSDARADRDRVADREVALPRPAVSSDIPALTTPSNGSGVMPAAPVATAVGHIAWSRIDGDSRSLPARVTDVGTAALMGDDPSANHWVSRNGGVNWARVSQPSVTRSVGDLDWTVRSLAGEPTLWRHDDRSGMRPVEIDPGIATSEIEGFALRVDLMADPFPVTVSRGVYLPVAVRAEFPWRALLDLHPTRAYRLEIDVDGQPVRVASGDFHELDVERLQVSEVGPDRFEIRRPDGEWVGSFGAPPVGMSLADVVSGRPLTRWTQWTGDGFAPAASPWEAQDRVDIAATATVILARVVSPDRVTRIWRTVDGESWTEVELPVEPLDRASVTIEQLEGEVIATGFTERGVVSLATTDGITWDELAPIPGVNRRDRADFGWIAPPTRSEPQIRVSADGDEWELVDLRGMLGMEYSRWDVRISATAIGSRIFVIADREDARTLLIGAVSTE